MRVGLHVPRFTWENSPHQIAGKLAHIARRTDQAGVASLSVMDHFFQIRGVGPAEEEMLEAYTALGYLAGLTERIQLGALVTGVTYRNPALLVKQVTTLDVLSGGRAFFGIGAAWNDEEHVGLGVPFPPTAKRFEMLEETLRIALQMWAGDEAPFDGEIYQLQRPLNSPQSVRRPHPPIMIGGSGERKTLRFIAKYGDACNIFDTGDEFIKHKLDVLREHCEREGRPYEAIEKTTTGRVPVGESPDVVVQRFRELAALGVDRGIVSFGDAADDASLDLLAEVVAKVADIVPAGR
jgi:F420-dependent oxidoreductase-like protein